MSCNLRALGLLVALSSVSLILVTRATIVIKTPGCDSQRDKYGTFVPDRGEHVTRDICTAIEGQVKEFYGCFMTMVDVRELTPVSFRENRDGTWVIQAFFHTASSYASQIVRVHVQKLGNGKYKIIGFIPGGHDIPVPCAIDGITSPCKADDEYKPPPPYYNPRLTTPGPSDEETAATTERPDDSDSDRQLPRHGTSLFAW